MYKTYRFGAILVVGLLAVNLRLHAAQKEARVAVELASVLSAQEGDIATIVQEPQAASLQPDWRLEVFKQRNQKEIIKDLERNGFNHNFSKDIVAAGCREKMTVGGLYLVVSSLYTSSILPEQPSSAKPNDSKDSIGKIMRIACSMDVKVLKDLKRNGIVPVSVKLPEAKEICSRLEAFPDLCLFLQKTELPTHLKGAELTPSEVLNSVNAAIKKYTEEMNKLSSTAADIAQTIMTARRDEIINALLQDYPDALAELKNLKNTNETSEEESKV